MFTLEPNIFPDVNAQNVIFIVRPKLHLMDIIADYVLKYVILFSLFLIYIYKIYFVYNHYFKSIYVTDCKCNRMALSELQLT